MVYKVTKGHILGAGNARSYPLTPHLLTPTSPESDFLSVNHGLVGPPANVENGSRPTGDPQSSDLGGVRSFVSGHWLRRGEVCTGVDRLRRVGFAGRADRHHVLKLGLHHEREV